MIDKALQSNGIFEMQRYIICSFNLKEKNNFEKLFTFI